MAFGRASVWFDVTDNHVCGAVVARGEITRTHKQEAASGWSDETLAGAITECLTALEVKNARVDVFWRRDGASTTVVQTPVTGKAAPSAAMLTMLESGGIDTFKQATEAQVLAKNSDGDSHVLISTVDQTRIDWLHQAIEDAGGTLGRVFAGEAVAAHEAITLTTGLDHSEPAVSIVPGENVSAIAITVGGNIKLVRFADIGMSSLREAYERALEKSELPPEERSTLAQTLLHETVGVPAPGEPIVDGVKATDILRVMQPALQRIAVELKQSIRFTLDSGDRTRVHFRIGGPARGIKHLERLLAEQIEAEDAVSVSETSVETATLFSLAKSAGVHHWHGVELGTSGQESAGVSVRPFWSGVAAALLMLVGIGVLAQNATTQLSAEATEISNDLHDQRAAEMTEEELLASRAVDAITEAIEGQYAVRADLGAALRFFSEIAASGVGIDAFSSQRGGEATVVHLRARAAGSDAKDARRVLQEFVSTLDASPITAGVVVGSIRIIDEPTMVYATFDATISLNETLAGWLPREVTP